MARNKTVIVTDKYRLKEQIVAELFNLFAHSLKINGVSAMEEAFIKRELFYNNRVAYDSATKTWYQVSGTSEPNKYRKPTKLTLTSGNGITRCNRVASYEPDELGCFMIDFSPFEDNWYNYTNMVASQLADIRIAILQNAKAVKSPLIIPVPNKDTAETIKLACEEKEDGAPTIIVDSDIAMILKGIETKTTYVGDKLLLLYDELRCKYLTRIGFLTRINNTMQRIQSAEVYAIVGEAHDSIHSYIDYWNDQIESYNLKTFNMELRGSLDKIYTDALMQQTNNPSDAQIKGVKVTSND